MENQYDVVVIGLGAMGAATLYQLARLGVKAVGIDRYLSPHDQGSSHGDTRITRLAVGEGEAYVPLVRNSHRIWRELEAETGDSLFEQCGVLILNTTDLPGSHHGTADFTAQTITVAQNCGIAHEVLSGTEIRERFAQFGKVADSAVGYFEPSGGYVRPEKCIAAQLNLAQKLGATLMTGSTVTGIESTQGQVRVSTAEGTIAASKAIVCAGMWSNELLGAPFDRLLKVCRQNLFWFRLDEPSIFPWASPCFILTHGPNESDICYGFPPIPGEGSMKIATEQFDVSTTAQSIDRTLSLSQAEAFYRGHMEGQFVGVSADLLKSSVCAYTVTPDFGFIIDEHPGLRNVTVVSACSGHGFKHSAGIGEALAQRVAYGKSEVDLSAFSVGRFA